MKILSTRPRRIAASALAALAVAVGGTMAANAQTAPPSSTSFWLFPNATVKNCFAAPGHAPTARVTVHRGRLNDGLVLEIDGFKPNLDFDVFTVETVPQLSNGQPNPRRDTNLGPPACHGGVLDRMTLGTMVQRLGPVLDHLNVAADRRNQLREVVEIRNVVALDRVRPE